MRPIKTAESDFNFGPPRGRENSIGDLPCKKDVEDGMSVVYSVWEPSAIERAAIARGENLRIGVFGLVGMVPISLGITHLKEEA